MEFVTKEWLTSPPSLSLQVWDQMSLALICHLPAVVLLHLTGVMVQLEIWLMPFDDHSP